MEYRILGPLEVVGDDGPIQLGGPKPRTLLAVLLAAAGRPVSFDRIVDELWGDAPPVAAAGTLHGYVSRLRRLLPDGALITEGRHYLLRVAPGEVDRDRFEHAVDRGRAALADDKPERAAAVLREGLALWRGPALAEMAGGAAPEPVRLEELRRTAAEDLLDAELARGQHAAVMAELEHAVAEEPLRERRWEQLLLALYRCGRQADALRRYQEVRTLLGEELGLDPGPALASLERSILAQDPSLDLVAPARRDHPKRSRVPAPFSSFVGRVEEIAAVEQMMRTNRLVTLVGPGGVGKTRLATEIARARPADDDREIAFVELASITDPALLAELVAGGFGGDEPTADDPGESVAAVLRGREALLVLDNCEHLVAACADLASSLLRQVPRLHVLATSREPLGVPGEAVWRVAPLTIDEDVELLRQRAGQSAPEDNAGMAALCRRLDGLPLAIELAAARLRTMSLEQLTAGLDEGSGVLGSGPRTADPRHRTLRGLVEWSHALLDDEDQRLLATLSVFAGSFEPEAAAAVATEVDGVGRLDDLVRLADLADKSLIEPAPDGRFRMLDTIRAFASDRLDALGLAESARTSHLGWFAEMARLASAHLRGADQAAWLERCEADYANLHSAAEWGLADQSRAPAALQLVADLHRFFLVRGHVVAGRRLLEAALEGAPEMSVTRAWAAQRAGGLAELLGDVAAARTHQETALRLARELGNSDVEAVALNEMGTTARAAGDLRSATELGEEAVRVARRGAGDAALGTCLCNLAGTHLERGRHAAARDLYEEARVILQREGDLFGLSVTVDNLAVAAFQEGDLPASRRFLAKAHALHTALGDASGLALNALQRAQLEMVDGDLKAAETVGAEALAGLREVGNPIVVSIALGTVAEIRLAQGLDPRELLVEKIGLDQSIGFLAGEATALVLEARWAQDGDDLEAAHSTALAALDAARRSGNDMVIASALTAVADIDGRRGSPDAAVAMHREALEIFRALGHGRNIRESLEACAAMAEQAGDVVAMAALRREAAELTTEQRGDPRD